MVIVVIYYNHREEKGETKMKVYLIVEGYDYEGSSVVKVFADRAKAEEYKKEIIRDYCEFWEINAEEYEQDSYYVEIQEKEVE